MNNAKKFIEELDNTLGEGWRDDTDALINAFETYLNKNQHPYKHIFQQMCMVIDEDKHFSGAERILINGSIILKSSNMGAGIKISCIDSKCLKVMITGRNEIQIFVD